jgi:outer membrane protein OmpA-like peptidoglycan-associated protein
MKRACLLFCLVAAGCGSQLRERVGVIDQLIEKARNQGAYKCAPRELAMAVSHVDFARTELDAGVYWHALDEVETAEDNARIALAKSPKAKCAPEAPKLPPKPVPKPEPKILDTDGDGIPDNVDKCPLEPEDKDGFQDEDGCPDPDNDQDGILDKNDKCPNEPEDKDGFEDDDGCPDIDNDKDGLVDAEDKCPNAAGPRENQGCPDTDKDGDGVVDRLDKCPEVPGPKENNGCPEEKKFIVVTKDKIELKQKVHFATNKATIYPDSFPMLNEIADVLKSRGEIRVRIEGHTDIRGGLKKNMKLSQDRAESVRKFLVDHGVDPTHMESRGFGPTQPIDSNKTSSGREANRRVEFIITAQ